ncbi:MAG: pyridoxal-phosphate dependent enzyme [Pseudomonadota bacterium]
MTDFLGNAFPGIAGSLPRIAIATLPTPVSRHCTQIYRDSRMVYVKHDDQTSPLYGGNKVRKLEYILGRALDRGAKRVATFGAAGSNHALATAIHANQVGLACTCFLSNQRSTPKVPVTLAKHAEIGTEIVSYRRAPSKVHLFRKFLQHRDAWAVPLGGTCWYGALGFVNAALELAAQIEAGELECPSRIYVANGTMGTATGLALGLALVELPCDLHVVRVAATDYANSDRLQHMLEKTAALMHRLDASVPADLASGVRVTWRDGFFAGGYAHYDEATLNAVGFAAEQLDLSLETTYTGKAMAALIQDAATHDAPVLFWNTYNSVPLEMPDDFCARDVPKEFRRYFDY